MNSSSSDEEYFDEESLPKEVQAKIDELRAMISDEVDLKRAFRRLSLKYHPDKGGKKNGADFQDLMTAFNYLKTNPQSQSSSAQKDSAEKEAPAPAPQVISRRTQIINEIRELYPLFVDMKCANVNLSKKDVPDEVRQKIAELIGDEDKQILKEFSVGLFRVLFGRSLSKMRFYTDRDDEVFLLAVVMRIYFVRIKDGKRLASADTIYSVKYKEIDVHGYPKHQRYAKLDHLKDAYFRSKYCESCILPAFVVDRLPVKITTWFGGSDFVLEKETSGMSGGNNDEHFKIFFGLQFDGSNAKFPESCPITRGETTFDHGATFDTIDAIVRENEANNRPASNVESWFQRLLIRDYLESGRNKVQFLCLGQRQCFEFTNPHTKVPVCTWIIGKQGTFKTAMKSDWRKVLWGAEFCASVKTLNLLASGGSSNDTWFMMNKKNKVVNDVDTKGIKIKSKQWEALKAVITEDTAHFKKLGTSIIGDVKEIGTLFLMANNVHDLDRALKEEGEDQRRHHVVQVCGDYALDGKCRHLRKEEVLLATEPIYADKALHKINASEEEKHALRLKQEQTAEQYAFYYRNLQMPPTYDITEFPRLKMLERTPEEQAKHVGTDLQKFLVSMCR